MNEVSWSILAYLHTCIRVQCHIPPYVLYFRFLDANWDAMSFLCTEVIWLLGLLLVYYIFDRLIRRPRITRFNDLYILVTGCDTGFGRTTAMRLDALGCHVFAGCLTETGELYMRKVCSHRLHTLRLDVSKPESVQQAYEFVQSKLPSGKGIRTQW